MLSVHLLSLLWFGTVWPIIGGGGDVADMCCFLQSEVEEKVRLIYDDYEGVIKGEVPFLRDNHVAYLKKGIR